jgi:predicted adenylyl cyclase CyaB
MHLNVEFKARCSDPGRVRAVLNEKNAEFIGTDHQVDTYFNCPAGRLKLREGTIEYALIFYDRTDQAGPKRAHIHLYQPDPDPALKELLTAALGIKTVVDKMREIYFIENVKFHIDTVQSLGNFIEVEAIDATGITDETTLREQCEYYLALFNVKKEDLVSCSYSDMMPGDG